MRKVGSGAIRTAAAGPAPLAVTRGLHARVDGPDRLYDLTTALAG